ncbi:MAG: hypothetical protein KJ950_11005 [Proteobacteria bacterium]|nr:hypothetical protein [Pseudomonadota bacterium]MBU1687713.1 hypothetical protein [Pseudomonadota bacterium]
MTQNLRPWFLVIIGLGLSLLIIQPLNGSDLWWHLHSGLWMLDHHQILQTDYWSFSEYGKDWLNVSWFFQILLGLAYQAGAEWGLLLLKYLFTFTGLLLLIRAATREQHPGYFFLAFLILLPSIHGHLFLRSLIYEFAALSYVIWVSQRPFNRRLGFFSLLVLIGWANSHASIVVGACALALQVCIAQWPAEKDRKASLIFAGLFLLTPFLSPLGFKILDLLLIHEESMGSSYYIAEWYHLTSYPPALWLPFLAVLGGFLAKKVRLSPAEGFLLLFFLYFSIRSQRFELEFATLLLRPLATIIGKAVETAKEAKTPTPALLPLLLIALHLLVNRAQFLDLPIIKGSDWPMARAEFPVITSGLAKAIADDLGRPLRVINDYDFGGYIPFRTQGKVQVIIDGRMSSLFPEDLLMLPYRDNPTLVDQLADRYDAQAVILQMDRAGLLLGSGNWTQIGYDQASVLYLRTELAKDMNLPDINYNPAVYSNRAHPGLTEHIAATEQLLSYDQSNTLALNHLALFKSTQAKTTPEREEVYRLLRLSDQTNPHDSFARATLAYLLSAEITSNREALKSFISTLPPPNTLSDSIPIDYDLTFAETLIKVGAAEMAEGYLYPKQFVRRRNLDIQAKTWWLRATMDLKIGTFKRAKQNIEMARLLYPPGDDHQQQLNAMVEQLSPKHQGPQQ